MISFINLASVAAIEDMVGATVDPLRFRANIYVEGWPAWSELDLVGQELELFPPPLAGEGQGGGKERDSARTNKKTSKQPRFHPCG